MARETRVVQMCDKCGKDESVHDLTVVYQHGHNSPWEVDLCQQCYDLLLGGLEDKGRTPTIRAIRPPAKFKKTTLTPDML